MKRDDLHFVNSIFTYLFSIFQNEPTLAAINLTVLFVPVSQLDGLAVFRHFFGMSLQSLQIVPPA